MKTYKLISIVFTIALASCGSQSSPSIGPEPTSVPRSQHVVIVALENHSYEQVIGNSDMPYFNGLAAQYGLANQYFANLHDSLIDLMFITAGDSVVPGDTTQLTYDVDNIARQLVKDGRSWRVYASNLPSVGYLGFDTGGYMKHHNPISYFTDVQGSLRKNMVPLAPFFPQDLANGALPDYSYVIPDIDDDAHSGSLAQADAWMSANLPQLLESSQFQKDGLLFIVWDEGGVNPQDDRGGGGRVANLVIGPHAKRGYQSPFVHNHLDLLATVCAALQTSSCPGGGATGIPMGEFFQ